MKNIFCILGLTLLTLTFISCQKEDANEDVKLAIAKLEQYNEKFTEFNQDGVIAKNIVEGEKKSEYDKLAKIADEFYGLMNSINNKVKEEAEKIEKGKNPKKLTDYNATYKLATDQQKKEIDAAYKLFMKNIEQID